MQYVLFFIKQIYAQKRNFQRAGNFKYVPLKHFKQHYIHVSFRK